MPRNIRKTFGVEFDIETYEGILSTIEKIISVNGQFSLTYMNMHGTYIYSQNEQYRVALDSFDSIYCDGAPLLWWRYILWKDVTSENRFTLTHLLPHLLHWCATRGIGVHYIGSSHAVLEKGINRLGVMIPELNLTGSSGFFDKTPGSADFERVIADTNASGAQLVLVGMGMPIQELWTTHARDRLKANILWNCGASLEYYAESLPIAPIWMNKIGLEWFFRLLNNPRKMAYRYLAEPIKMAPRIIGDIKNRL